METNTFKTITVAEAIEDFLNGYQNANTRNVYRSSLRQVSGWIGVDRRMVHVERRDIRAFIARVVNCDDCNSGGPYSSNTRIGKLKALSAWLNFCHREGYTEGNLAGAITIPAAEVVDAREKAYTDTEADKLIAYARGETDKSGLRPRDLALILLAYDTGARRGSLALIQRKHIDLASGVVRLRNTKMRRWYSATFGDYTAKVLREYLLGLPEDEDAFLWNSRKPGQPMQAASVGQIILRACQEAGVDPEGIHGFRRGLGVRMIDQDHSSDYVADALDDDPVTVRKHYAPRQIPAAKLAARKVAYMPPSQRKIRRFESG